MEDDWPLMNAPLLPPTPDPHALPGSEPPRGAMRVQAGGTPRDSRALILKPVLEENCNALGHVEAGHLLKLIDVVGVASAFRHLNTGNVFVTASLDRTNFVRPVHAWEFVRMESRITQVWGSSLETEVTVSASGLRERDTVCHPVATAYLTYVALDAQRNKVVLPSLTLGCVSDARRARLADIRRANRREEAAQAPELTLNATDADRVSLITRVMTRKESNSLGNVFGGVILELISAAGQQAALHHAGQGPMIMARIDRMSFLAPAFVGETIQARAIPTKTWKTSMETQVSVEAIAPGDPFHPRLIAQCYLIFVRLDEATERPALLPHWTPDTPQQAQRAEAADLRRQFRQSEAQLASGDKWPPMPLWPRLTLHTRDILARLARVDALWKDT